MDCRAAIILVCVLLASCGASKKTVATTSAVEVEHHQATESIVATSERQFSDWHFAADSFSFAITADSVRRSDGTTFYRPTYAVVATKPASTSQRITEIETIQAITDTATTKATEQIATAKSESKSQGRGPWAVGLLLLTALLLGVWLALHPPKV